MSASTLLTAVDTAIAALLTHKISSYTLDGVAYTYHNLDTLRRLRKDLLMQCRTSRNTMRPADYSGDYS